MEDKQPISRDKTNAKYPSPSFFRLESLVSPWGIEGDPELFDIN